MNNQYGFENQNDGNNGNGMQGMNNMGNGMQGMNTNSSAPGYTLWLLLGISQIVLCCCSCNNIITGILTVVFAVLANNAFKTNNMAMFYSRIKLAKVINIIGWALCLLGIVVNFFAGIYSVLFEIAPQL